jgi:hypothetical protein
MEYTAINASTNAHNGTAAIFACSYSPSFPFAISRFPFFVTGATVFDVQRWLRLLVLLISVIIVQYANITNLT